MLRVSLLSLFAALAVNPPQAQPVTFDADARRVTCETPEQITADGEATLTLRFKPDGTVLSVASHGDPRPLIRAATSVAAGCTAAGQGDTTVRATFRFTSGEAGLLQILPQPPSPPQETDIYEFSEVPPVLVGGIAGLQAGIRYPTDAITAEIVGRVIVQFVVELDGTASDIVVVRSVYPSIDAASVDAVRRARFEPGREGRRPVRVRLTLPVTFNLR